MSGQTAPDALLKTRVSSGHFIVAFAGSRTDDFHMKSSHSTQEARTMPATLFSVTLDVRFNGDSHGTITEVVEADTAAAAETQLVDQAREMLPSNRTVHPILTVQLTDEVESNRVRPTWASAPEGFVRDPGTGELYPVDALPAPGSPARTRIDREGR